MSHKMRELPSFSFAAEAGGVGLWEWKRSTKGLILTPLAMELLGVEDARGEILTLDDVPTLSKGDKAALRAKRAECSSGSSFVHDCEIDEREGPGRRIRIRGVPYYGEDGRLAKMGGSIRDVSESKFLEEQVAKREDSLRSILNVSPYPIIVTLPPTGKILFRNRMAMEVFDVPEGETGRFNAQRFIESPEDLEKIREDVKLAGCSQCIIPVRSIDGRLFRGEFTARMVEFEGQLGCCITIRDIENALRMQEQINYEKELVQLQAEEMSKLANEAERANRAKSEFLAMMSHEIRTPMNGVIGAAKLLSGMNLPDDQEKLVSVNSESGNGLLRVIDDILDYAKLEAGRFELDPQPTDLGRTFQSMVDLMAPKAEEKGLSLVLEAIAPKAQHVVIDDVRIRQVILNLLSNAIKFTNDGHIKLSYAPEPAIDGTVTLNISVSDTGIGIAPEAQKLLFRHFTQADQSISRKFGGTGLGLAICRQIVDLMGGSIWLESEEGKGTTFHVSIPALESEAGWEPNKTGSLRMGDPSSLAGKVLIVDDNAANRLVFGTMLKATQCDVSLAENGEEALMILENQQFDIIFMDVQMPGINGIDMTKLIRLYNDKYGNPVVVALTANASESDRKTCIISGMNDFLSKPVEPEGLYAMLERWLPPTTVATGPIAEAG